MREIKFRVWDNQECKMVYDGIIDKYESMWGFENTKLFIDFDGSISSFIDDDGGKNGLHEHEGEVEASRCTLMQYTGLKDKNGVEIYEGDIVLHRKAGLSEMVHGEVFIEPTRGVVVKNWPISFDIEVIGNKYEHPELLEEP